MVLAEPVSGRTAGTDFPFHGWSFARPGARSDAGEGGIAAGAGVEGPATQRLDTASGVRLQARTVPDVVSGFALGRCFPGGHAQLHRDLYAGRRAVVGRIQIAASEHRGDGPDRMRAGISDAVDLPAERSAVVRPGVLQRRRASVVFQLLSVG